MTGWFETQRSLAVSLVSAGIGIAPVTMTPLAAWLVATYDWRISMQVLALVAAVSSSRHVSSAPAAGTEQPPAARGGAG